MIKLRREGDSVGARVNVVATGVPPGLGEPVFDRLDADIAYAMMSINAVKGVEIGAGFAAVEQKGSAASRRADAARLPLQQRRRRARRDFLGSGHLVSIALKPTSSITIPGRTIDIDGNAVEVVTTGVTIPVWVCAPRRSPKPCWRWC